MVGCNRSTKVADLSPEDVTKFGVKSYEQHQRNIPCRHCSCKRKAEASHLCRVECHPALPVMQQWCVTVGWILMRERELNRVEGLGEVAQGGMATATA